MTLLFLSDMLLCPRTTDLMTEKFDLIVLTVSNLNHDFFLTKILSYTMSLFTHFFHIFTLFTHFFSFYTFTFFKFEYRTSVEF